LAFFLAPPWPPLFPCRRGRQGLWRPADGGEEEVEEEGEADEDAVAASCPCWVWWWAGGQVTSATCPRAHSSSTRRRKAWSERRGRCPGPWTHATTTHARRRRPHHPPPPLDPLSMRCVNLPRRGLAGRRPWRKRRWRVGRLESVMVSARWRLLLLAGSTTKAARELRSPPRVVAKEREARRLCCVARTPIFGEGRSKSEVMRGGRGKPSHAHEEWALPLHKSSYTPLQSHNTTTPSQGCASGACGARTSGHSRCPERLTRVLFLQCEFEPSSSLCLFLLFTDCVFPPAHHHHITTPTHKTGILTSVRPCRWRRPSPTNKHSRRRRPSLRDLPSL